MRTVPKWTMYRKEPENPETRLYKKGKSAMTIRGSGEIKLNYYNEKGEWVTIVRKPHLGMTEYRVSRFMYK